MTQIITIGGGGFLSGSDAELDAYVLEQASSVSPNIGFVGTASGDDARFAVRFFSRYSNLNCTPSALNLFGRVPNLEQWIEDQDVIFVGGGNTKSMLGVWEAWNIPALLKDALSNGTVLAGVSAGAICWFESGITDSMSADYSALPGLGFLAGSCCPHYDAEPGRVPVYEKLIQAEEIKPGIAIDDGVAVHWVDGSIKRVVAARNSANAYKVRLENGAVVTESLLAEY